jgi:DNA-binding NtrC family response regulator
LLIDGDPAFRDGMAEALRARSFAVEIAETCKAALEMARRRRCEVVIMDLPEPAPPGFALVQTLRWIAPDVQLVLMTGSGPVQSTVDAVGAYVEACISKPFDPNALADALRSRVRPA